MPILKTEILGSIIEISFQEKEKEKLLKIISRFKKRLKEFENIEGKINNSKIIFFAALKAEDQIEELENLLKLRDKEKVNVEDQKIQLSNLTKEIVLLKDKIIALNKKNSLLEITNSKATDAIENIEEKLERIHNNILSNTDEEH